MRIDPRTDISASRSWGGAARPGRSGAAGEARALSGGAAMASGRSYQRPRRACTRCCRSLRGTVSGPSQSRCETLLLVDDERLDRRRHVVGDLDDDHVGADVLDRLLEVDLPAVDLQPARVAGRVGA